MTFWLAALSSARQRLAALFTWCLFFAKSRLANTPLNVSVYEVKWIQSHYALIIKFKNMSLFANRKELPTSTLSIFIFQSTTGVVIAVDSMNCKITIIKSFEWESVLHINIMKWCCLFTLKNYFYWNVLLKKTHYLFLCCQALGLVLENLTIY